MDDDRGKENPIESLDFLGYTFRPRRAKNKHGKFFVSFLPAISNKAKSKIRETIRGWRIHLITWTSLGKIAEKVNPVLRGWYQYYGRFYKYKNDDFVFLGVLKKRIMLFFISNGGERPMSRIYDYMIF